MKIELIGAPKNIMSNPLSKHHTIFNISPDIPYALTGDVGYPMTAELPDGSLLTVFYTRVNAKSANILAQKWRMCDK